MKALNTLRIVPQIFISLFCLLILIVGFVMISSNEGSVDFSRIAKKAKEVDPNKPIPEKYDNKLVYASGILKSEESIGDTFLVAGRYISVKRKVEMYSWKETSRTGNNNGGNKYDYRKIWASRPSNSNNFRYSENHVNPKKIIPDNEVRVNTAKLGNYVVDVSQLELPEHKVLSIGPNNVIQRNNFVIANSKYLYSGNGSYQNPQIGDVRVSYLVLNNPLSNVTIFGSPDLINEQIVPYYNKDTKFYRLFVDTEEGAIQKMSDEYIHTLWIWRGIGFVMVFFGLIGFTQWAARYSNGYVLVSNTFKLKLGLFTFLFALIVTALIILLSNVALWGSTLVFILFVITIIFAIRLIVKGRRHQKEKMAKEENEINV